MIIILLPGIVLGSIVFHEMGHILSLIVTKIGVHGIFFPFFALLFENGGMRIVKTKKSRSVYVLPHAGKMGDACAYEKYKKKYLFTLLMGPVFTAVLIITALIGIMAGEYVFFWRMMLLVNLFFLASCCKADNSALGDIVAYKRLKENDNLFLTYFLSFFATDAEST